MNGIEPPTPMSTGATPSQASSNAARAASYAGPVASIWVGSPVSTTVKVSWAPQGTCASQCLRRHSTALAVVSPGAMRRLSLARAIGTRVLLAPSTFGASRPVTVSAGRVQSRSTIEPSPIHSTDRVGARLGAQPLLGVLDVGGRALEEAGDGDVAGVVVEARDHPAQRHDRVGHQAAPHAGVDAVAEGAHLDVGAHQAAQRGGQRRLADVPVAGVGDHDHVGAQLVVVLLQQRRAGCRSRPPPRPR